MSDYSVMIYATEDMARADGQYLHVCDMATKGSAVSFAKWGSKHAPGYWAVTDYRRGAVLVDIYHGGKALAHA